MFVRPCEKHRVSFQDAEELDGLTVGERLVKLATEAVEDKLDCPDCQVLYSIVF